MLEEELLWIKHIKSGRHEFFPKLYERHKAKIFALCYRFTGNQSDAEEQLQEVFMRILHKIDAFQGSSSFATWAFRLATNHLLNFKQRRKDRLEDSMESQPEPTAPDRDIPLALVLAKAVASLPDGFRKVFVLHDQEGLKHEEIAELLQISAATSRSQLARARLALREKLQPMLHLEEVRHGTP